MLEYVALFVIVFLITAVAAVIVFLGSLPGKIARRRGHPYPDAVNAASWIGLATGIFWPVAFIWAFLPYPALATGATSDSAEPTGDLAKLQERLAALESELKELKARPVEDAS